MRTDKRKEKDLIKMKKEKKKGRKKDKSGTGKKWSQSGKGFRYWNRIQQENNIETQNTSRSPSLFFHEFC